MVSFTTNNLMIEKKLNINNSLALAHLCEFIEDCEFTKLSVRILHLIGVEGPKTPQPTKYIRYIYNRVVLENAVVRAAAVTALAKFGVGQQDPEVNRSVSVLLTRCLDDTDDEVRDRAALNLRLMSEEDEIANRFVKNGQSTLHRQNGALLISVRFHVLAFDI
jgi:coatomer subunit gamma